MSPGQNRVEPIMIIMIVTGSVEQRSGNSVFSVKPAATALKSNDKLKHTISIKQS